MEYVRVAKSVDHPINPSGYNDVRSKSKNNLVRNSTDRVVYIDNKNNVWVRKNDLDDTSNFLPDNVVCMIHHQR